MPPLWSALTLPEINEMRKIIYAIDAWVNYCDNCRKSKAPINQAKAPPDAMFFRQAELRNKMWGDLRNWP